MTNETKQCTKCGEEKPATLEYFYECKKVKSGFAPECRGCRREREKDYREKNKGHISKRRSEARKKSKGAYLERERAYHALDKERWLQYYKDYYRTPKGKFRNMKKGAKKRNINFSLSFDLYESQIWGKPCHYCGCEIEVTGLDRKNSNKGYSSDNVVPCCFDCNNKKSTKPYEDFIAEVKNEKGNG